MSETDKQTNGQKLGQTTNKDVPKRFAFYENKRIYKKLNFRV